MIKGTLMTDTYDLEYTKDEQGVTIVSCLMDEPEMVIPSQIDGLPVIRIASEAFSYKKMKYIRLPEQLEYIDHHAFSGCRNIRHIEFPASLKVIGNYAFYNCWELKEIHLPSRMQSIGFGAFMNCEKMTELVQDKEEGHEISIGSILNDLSQQIHVVIRHLSPGREPVIAKVLFTEYSYEIVTVVSICKRAAEKPTGTGVQMRYCVGSNDIDYLKYDSMFHVLKRDDGFDAVVTAAVERLMFPYMLTGEARRRYMDYIREHALEAALKFLREDCLDKLRFITDQGVLEREQIDAVIDESISRDMTEATAFLMDYRHKNYDMAEEEFVL